MANKETDNSRHVKEVVAQVTNLGIASYPDNASFRAAVAQKLPRGSYASFYVEDAKSIVIVDKGYVKGLLDAADKKVDAKKAAAAKKDAAKVAKLAPAPKLDNPEATKVVDNSEVSA